eukprot:12243860-Alexandrium_andersonii.AAC.1
MIAKWEPRMIVLCSPVLCTAVPDLSISKCAPEEATCHGESGTRNCECAMYATVDSKGRGRSSVELRPHAGRRPAGVRGRNCTRDGQQAFGT